MGCFPVTFTTTVAGCVDMWDDCRKPQDRGEETKSGKETFMLQGRWYWSGESNLDRCCPGKGEHSWLENSLSIPLRAKDGFSKDSTNFYTLLGDGGEKKTMLSAAGVGELHHPTSLG